MEGEGDVWRVRGDVWRASGDVWRVRVSGGDFKGPHLFLAVVQRIRKSIQKTII